MGTTTFVWDPVFDCVSHELDENNDVKVVYNNEPQQYGGVLSQRRGTTSHYHHHDALGSTRFLTDSSGNVTDTYLNDAWGNSVASTGTTINPFKWVGKYGYYTDDSTGQVYVRARMYQPTVARWVSMDPVPIELTDLNLLRYVRNNSLRSTDPSGLVEPCTVVIVGGIIVVWLCSGCSEPPPPAPKCKDANIEPAVTSIQSPLPPWAGRPVECDPKGQNNPNLFAQTSCENGRIVQRICKQGLPRLPNRKCITECLVQKEDYVVAMTKCCASIPCLGNQIVAGDNRCQKALDCYTFKPFATCLEACLKAPPPYHPDNPDDRDHEVIKRLRELNKRIEKQCANVSHPCEACS